MPSCSDKAYHGRIDWDLAKRFLHVIHKDGPLNKTGLAMKAGVNYSCCIRYISWLKEVGWIDTTDQGLVSLNEAGIVMRTRLENISRINAPLL